MCKSLHCGCCGCCSQLKSVVSCQSTVYIRQSTSPANSPPPITWADCLSALTYLYHLYWCVLSRHRLWLTLLVVEESQRCAGVPTTPPRTFFVGSSRWVRFAVYELRMRIFNDCVPLQCCLSLVKRLVFVRVVNSGAQVVAICGPVVFLWHNKCR